MLLSAAADADTTGRRPFPHIFNDLTTPSLIQHCQLSIDDIIPWDPELSEEEVARAQGYFGSGTRIRKVAAKLRAGQPIKVSVVAAASRPTAGYPC